MIFLDFVFGPALQKDITQRPFCWSTTPNPPVRKLVVKVNTNRKHKML